MLRVLLGYIGWHFGSSVTSLTTIWRHLAHHIYRRFSIRLLLSTFFDPWKRMGETYTGQFDVAAMARTALVNAIMRLVGVLLRSVVIFCGLTCYIIFLCLYPVVIILWLFLPLIAVGFIVNGLYIILS